MPRTRAAARGEFAGSLTHMLRPELGSMEVIDTAADALLGGVPADIWCGVSLDPSTLLDTGGQHVHGFPAEIMPRLFEIEHAEQDDVDSLRNLARRGVRTSTLHGSTAGELATSKYYREILQPLGLGDELRVLLRDGEQVWGLLVLCRAAESGPFTSAEKALAEALARPAADALRRSLLLAGIDTGDLTDAPGLVMLDWDLARHSSSPTAQRWLDQIQERHRAGAPDLPYAVRAIASQLRTDGEGYATARARTRTGGWICLHAWRVDRADERMIAVSIGPADSGQRAAIILAAYGLSPREQQVAQLVLLGRATHDIAAALQISGYTVQDHLKAIFNKTSVRSRRELVGELFARHYLPVLGQGPLTTDGRLLAPGTVAADAAPGSDAPAAPA